MENNYDTIWEAMQQAGKKVDPINEDAAQDFDDKINADYEAGMADDGAMSEEEWDDKLNQARADRRGADMVDDTEVKDGGASEITVDDTIELAKILGFEVDDDGNLITNMGVVPADEFHAKIVSDIEDMATQHATEDGVEESVNEEAEGLDEKYMSKDYVGVANILKTIKGNGSIVRKFTKFFQDESDSRKDGMFDADWFKAAAINESKDDCYICTYKDKRAEVHACSQSKALKEAQSMFKLTSKNRHKISATLSEKADMSESLEEGSMTKLDHDINRLFRKLDDLKDEGADKERGGTYDVMLKRLQNLTRERTENKKNQEFGISFHDTDESAVDESPVDRRMPMPGDDVKKESKPWLNTKEAYKDTAEKMAQANKHKDAAKFKFEFQHIRKMINLEDESNKREIDAFWRKAYKDYKNN